MGHEEKQREDRDGNQRQRHVVPRALRAGRVNQPVADRLFALRDSHLFGAREIVRKIKDSKLKVQAAIQGDLVRVSSRDRDTLQNVIKLLRDADFGIDMQFTNYRTF